MTLFARRRRFLGRYRPTKAVRYGFRGPRLKTGLRLCYFMYALVFFKRFDPRSFAITFIQRVGVLKVYRLSEVTVRGPARAARLGVGPDLAQRPAAVRAGSYAGSRGCLCQRQCRARTTFIVISPLSGGGGRRACPPRLHVSRATCARVTRARISWSCVWALPSGGPVSPGRARVARGAGAAARAGAKDKAVKY